MTRNKTSRGERIQLWFNTFLLLFFTCFVYFKTRGLGDHGWLSYPYIAGFAGLGLGLLMLVWNVGSRRWQQSPSKSRWDSERGGDRDGLSEISSRRDSTDPSEGNFDSHASSRNPKPWVIVFILYLALLFAYDFSVAEAWIDAKGDVQTAQLLRQQGIKDFLQTYHHQSAHDILHSAAGQKGLEQYARLLPFYPLEQRLRALDQSHEKLENNRRQHHPPSFFMILATWMGLSDSLLSIKVFAKFMLMLYLLFMWLLMRNLLKDKWLALSGTFALGLMPALLLASQAPRNDLQFGIVSALITLLLLNIAQSDRNPWWKHILLGMLCFLAIFSKFTALLIALPILAIYLYRFKMRAVQSLLLVALPGILIPILLYLLTGYDMLLNVITGRILQDAWIAENTSAWSFITQRVLFGQFRIGIPIMLLALYALPQLLKRKEQRPQVILFFFYLSSFFLLWGSSIDRHQIGFLPFAVPLISLALAQYQKLVKPIHILLLLYNLLFIFYAVSDNIHDLDQVLPL
jgi:hypothetical protein